MDARAGIVDALQAVRDLTARLQERADETAVLHRRYFDAFEFAPDARVITDGEGRVVAANLASEELLRVPRSRMTGRPLARFLGLRAKVVARAFDLPGGRCWQLRKA